MGPFLEAIKRIKLYKLFSFWRQLYLMYLQRLQRLVAKPPAHLQMCGPSPKIVLGHADKLSSFKLPGPK